MIELKDLEIFKKAIKGDIARDVFGLGRIVADLEILEKSIYDKNLEKMELDFNILKNDFYKYIKNKYNVNLNE